MVAVMQEPSSIEPLTMQELQQPINLLTLLSEDEANSLGRQAKDGYLRDKNSRQEWEKCLKDCWRAGC